MDVFSCLLADVGVADDIKGTLLDLAKEVADVNGQNGQEGIEDGETDADEDNQGGVARWRCFSEEVDPDGVDGYNSRE